VGSACFVHIETWQYRTPIYWEPVRYTAFQDVDGVSKGYTSEYFFRRSLHSLFSICPQILKLIFLLNFSSISIKVAGISALSDYGDYKFPPDPELQEGGLF
jgi:hypothetical protein